MMITAQEVYAENQASNKQCKDCIYYLDGWKDEYIINPRPACGFASTFDFVSHNPARTCKYYQNG